MMLPKNRMRELRKERKLTQKIIAQILKTNERQYSRWETGFTEIPAHHVVSLADFYQVSTDYLLGRTDDPTPPKDAKPYAPEEKAE